jgi:hypothetical protein
VDQVTTHGVGDVTLTTVLLEVAASHGPGVEFLGATVNEGDVFREGVSHVQRHPMVSEVGLLVLLT